ncbi:Uma2 family endonuclease [Nocardiopsis baichengensis]|uniref:Uma2 family endonuclease n=1 Tax=Nocardiopsis baichengensis TaxID=280240 RepID=UPI00036A813A|nr:Uma2 family endonuclease [Nocardiopsis baichengensis]
MEALPEGFKIELLSGVFVATPPSTLRRIGIKERIYRQLLHQLQPPIAPMQRTAVGLLDGDDYAIPDVVVVDLNEEGPDGNEWITSPDEVYLAVDVAPHSAGAGQVLDRAVMHAAFGVPLYLFADPRDGSLILHSTPTGSVYTPMNRMHFGDTVKFPFPLEGTVIKTDTFTIDS